LSWDLVLMITALVLLGLLAAVIGYAVIEASRTAKHRRGLELLAAQRGAGQEGPE
jgi:hypothetical protein